MTCVVRQQQLQRECDDIRNFSKRFGRFGYFFLFDDPVNPVLEFKQEILFNLSNKAIKMDEWKRAKEAKNRAKFQFLDWQKKFNLEMAVFNKSKCRYQLARQMFDQQKAAKLKFYKKCLHIFFIEFFCR